MNVGFSRGAKLNNDRACVQYVDAIDRSRGGIEDDGCLGKQPFAWEQHHAKDDAEHGAKDPTMGFSVKGGQVSMHRLWQLKACLVFVSHQGTTQEGSSPNQASELRLAEMH
jgi:hypothetical protein